MSVGEYLARQRRLRGISMDELSELTRIPSRNLERLESGAFDDQPDGFARGFVRTVAEALGLDPDEAVMRLMPEPEADALPSPGGARQVVLRLAAVSLLAGLVVLVWKLGGAWLGAPADAPSEAEPQLPPPMTFRLDAVGKLARETEKQTPAPAAGPERAEPEPPAP